MGNKTVKLVGAFTWGSDERRSDRYGGIMLAQRAVNVNRGEHSPAISLTSAQCFVDQRVHISVRVLESNKSCHLGDLTRGIKPSKTPVGTIIDLGVGMMKEIADIDGEDSLIFCRDGREGMNDWMDPHQLYRLHDHVVELVIEDASDIPFTPITGGKHIGQRDGCIMVFYKDEQGGFYQTKATYEN